MSVFKKEILVLAILLSLGIGVESAHGDACTEKERIDNEIQSIALNQRKDQVLKKRAADVAEIMAAKNKNSITLEEANKIAEQRNPMPSDQDDAQTIRLKQLKKDLAKVEKQCSSEETIKKCTAKINADPKIWIWRDKTDESKGCRKDDKFADQKEPEYDDSDCRHANKFKGTTLHGERCSETASLLKETQTRNEAVNASSTALATAAATVNAMRTTGTAEDAQKAAHKTLIGMSLSKIAQGTSELKGAYDLRMASDDASDAALRMSNAYGAAKSTCLNEERPDVGAQAMNTCITTKLQSNNSISDIKPSEYSRLIGASNQTQAQADKAKSAASQSMISGLANTLVSIQAMQAAKKAQQNAVNMGSAPGLQTFMLTPVGSASTGALGAGVEDVNNQDEFPTLDTTSGFTFAGGGGAGIRGGLAKTMGGPGGAAPYGSAKSSVSGGSGGGAKGLGGGSGASKAPRRGSRGPTAIGDLGPGGSLPRYTPGGNGGGGAAGDTALTDALSKLLGGDPTNMQKEVPRGIASIGDDAEQESPLAEESAVYEQDVSLFQIVSAKYRQLSGRGAI